MEPAFKDHLLQETTFITYYPWVVSECRLYCILNLQFNKHGSKDWICLLKGRKHGGRRWKCLLQAFFFLHCFDKRLPRILTPYTHYQTTNFRLFQTERVCRRQFQIWQKRKKVIQTGRKHCGKRRNCSLRAISPFPSVFKRLVSQTCQKVSLCGNGLKNSKILELSKQTKHTNNNSNVNLVMIFIPKWLSAFSPFPSMFSKGFFLTVLKPRECLEKKIKVWDCVGKGSNKILFSKCFTLHFSPTSTKLDSKMQLNSCSKISLLPLLL